MNVTLASVSEILDSHRFLCFCLCYKTATKGSAKENVCATVMLSGAAHVRRDISANLSISINACGWSSLPLLKPVGNAYCPFGLGQPASSWSIARFLWLKLSFLVESFIDWYGKNENASVDFLEKKICSAHDVAPVHHLITQMWIHSCALL